MGRCSSLCLLYASNPEGRAEGWLGWKAHEGHGNAWSPDPGLFIDTPVAKISTAGTQKASQPSIHRDHSTGPSRSQRQCLWDRTCSGRGPQQPNHGLNTSGRAWSRRVFVQRDQRPGWHSHLIPTEEEDLIAVYQSQVHFSSSDTPHPMLAHMREALPCTILYPINCSGSQ